MSFFLNIFVQPSYMMYLPDKEIYLSDEFESTCYNFRLVTIIRILIKRALCA